MTRPLHGRRARRAQWLADAETMILLHRGHASLYLSSTEAAAVVLRARAAPRRARRPPPTAQR